MCSVRDIHYDCHLNAPNLNSGVTSKMGGFPLLLVKWSSFEAILIGS